jgi:hypothetical protein
MMMMMIALSIKHDDVDGGGLGTGHQTYLQGHSLPGLIARAAKIIVSKTSEPRDQVSSRQITRSQIVIVFQSLGSTMIQNGQGAVCELIAVVSSSNTL